MRGKLRLNAPDFPEGRQLAVLQTSPRSTLADCSGPAVSLSYLPVGDRCQFFEYARPIEHSESQLTHHTTGFLPWMG
jgi:hypothetical protein